MTSRIYEQGIEIEKGVPVPNRYRKTGGRRKGTSKYRLNELKVGESIVVPKVDRPSVVSSWGRYKPKEFTSAIDEDPTLCRIWRIK